MTLDILCKVVDNFGDIGVAYRLAKALSDREPSLGIRLVVEGLESFAALAPEVDPAAEIQALGNWTVLAWEPSAAAIEAAYRGERPRFVVECFACGKPDWFEALVFDDSKEGETVILNLEYLTAEPYARDFHLLPAATRSARVRKFFFMPGFEEGTAGLVIDERFRASRERFLDPARRAEARLEAARAAGLEPEAGRLEALWVLVFGYERDYGPLVADLASHSGGGPGLLALVAAGKSQACFLSAWEAAGRPFPAFPLPFLGQEAWDELLLASDLALVRGEESLARAALSGRPFAWQAYVQEGAHQLVKVGALLDRMRPCFAPAAFEPLERFFLDLNDRLSDSPGVRGDERLLPVLERLGELAPGFRRLSEELVGLGDLAQRLLTFFCGFL